MIDILLRETGNGGDILLRGNDFATVSGYENAVYLAMFGGSRWWANYMVDAPQKFLSKTEEALRTNALTSAGRIAIEDAAYEDLAFLKNIPGTVVKITTTLPAANRLDMVIDVNGQLFLLEWNPDKLYLTYKVG